MSRWSRAARHRRHDGRAEGGYALVEVLLVVTISTLILGPLFAWMMLSMRTQPVAEDGMIRTAAEGLLGTYLPRDVVGAAAATVDDSNDEVSFDDCAGGPGDNGDPVLALVVAGTTPKRIIYSEAAMNDGGAAHATKKSVWRRECLAETGMETAATEVVADVVPGQSSAVCLANAAEAPCRQIQFNVTPSSGNGPVSVRGTRRVDSASLRFDRAGNRLPVAKIEVVEQTFRPNASGRYEVKLSAASSEDPDGYIYQYDWIIPQTPFGQVGPGPLTPSVEMPLDANGVPTGPPADQPVEWELEGTYFVQLTVTDDSGAEVTTFKRIDFEVPEPVAAMQVTPTVGVAAQTVFAFEAEWLSQEAGEVVGTQNPSGLDLTYRWLIEPTAVVEYDENDEVVPQPPPPPDSRFELVTDVPTLWSSALPPSLLGEVDVTLTVVDEDGRSSSVSDTIELLVPGSAEEPADPNLPQPSFVAVPGAPPTGFDLDASGSTPGALAAPIQEYSWAFGPGIAPITSPDPTSSVTFPHGGTYRVTLTLTDSIGGTASLTQLVLVDPPGTVAAPAPMWNDPIIDWAPIPGAEFYLVDFQFDGPGCSRQLTVTVPGGTDTPSVPVMPNLCPQGVVPPTPTAQAQVTAVFGPGIDPTVGAPIDVGPQLFAAGGG